MPKLVGNGAKLKCSEGLSPGSLTILPVQMIDGANVPAATVNDFTPMLNVSSFGMCKTTANPQVASATSAASGTLTPMPCVPVITSPWSPGADLVTLAGQKALTANSKCSCAWSGSIEITDPACDVDIE
ncbi:MAG: DUF4280 domain-containing protein [Polyangiaceae bacterium]|nr:DUF4280 domain-containing protein [Polyangiaceae bacterium]